jgi:hypothetical protein
MVSLGILKDPSDKTIEQFLTDLQPTIERYNHLDDTWPFALPRLFISAHMFRLERMRYALRGYLESRAQEAIDQALNTTPAQSGSKMVPLTGTPRNSLAKTLVAAAAVNRSL